MSVAEGFLRKGKACTRVDSLASSFDECFSKWTLLLIFGRQWCRNKRVNKLYAPVFLMLFASSGDNDDNNEIINASENNPWYLLFYDMKHSCQEILWETKASELVLNIWNSVPVGLHPSSFSVICVTIGDTHEKIGLFSERAFSLFKERMEQAITPLGLKHTLIQRHNVKNIRRKQINDNNSVTNITSCKDDSNYLPIFIEEAIQWACDQTPDAVDVSAPSQKGNESILEILPELNKLLYTGQFQEYDENTVIKVLKESNENNKGLNSILMKERQLAVKKLKKRIGHISSFTLSSSLFSTKTELSWYVLIIQKPFIEKEEVSLENLDVGPLEPQPIGAELHLMRDGGEVLYLQEQLCDEKSFDTIFDDILHEDGELFVQLTPLEGISFDDIDNYLNFISTYKKEDEKNKFFNEELLSKPLCKGSCCGYTFPKVIYRRPTGTVAKDTSISTPHVIIAEETPHTPEEWEAARLALLFLSQNINPLHDELLLSYTFSNKIAPVQPPSHNEACAWCGRRRYKLLRCTGCRMDFYCCKKHQMMDWKGGHKKKCGLWKKSREEYETQVIPLLQLHQEKLPTSPSASTAVTLLQFLNNCKEELANTSIPIIHIIGIESGVENFLKELSDRLMGNLGNWKQLRLILCSDLFSEEMQNSVFAIEKNGNIKKTLPTSILGDTWHTKSDKTAVDAIALARIYNTKYHIFIGDNINEISKINTTSNNNNNNGEGNKPSAILSIGNSSGAGMNYFSAAAEIIADYFVGIIPVFCTEPTLLSAHRTLDAIVARIKSSSTIKKNNHTNKIISHLSNNVDDIILLNTTGMGIKPIESPEKIEKSNNVNTASLTKPISLISHPNLYYFYIPVEH